MDDQVLSTWGELGAVGVVGAICIALIVAGTKVAIAAIQKMRNGNGKHDG